MIMNTGADVFEIDRELIDVTSNNRPHVGHVVTDKAGHAHPWCGPDGKPAEHYSPSVRYNLPSLVWVKDGVAYYEDGEPYDVGHHECRICGEHIEPPYTADTQKMYAPGLMRCYINGQSVPHAEFEQRYEQAKKTARKSAQTMTFADWVKGPSLLPVKCIDGTFGVVIAWDQDTNTARVQVSGEDEAREISGAQLIDAGNGALKEFA